MRILAIEVRRNEMNHQRVDIPPHELPVLAYVHGEAACILMGEIELDDVPERLDANAEYSRLAQKYGRDKANESMEPRVAAVYGAGMRGVQALAEAIAFGQRPELPTEAFALAVQQPAHDAPANRLQPVTRSALQPLAHGASGTEKGQNAVPRPTKRTREGRAAPDVAEMPAAMQPGAAEERHSSTAKAKRKAAAGQK